jgi:hypothetical protein
MSKKNKKQISGLGLMVIHEHPQSFFLFCRYVPLGVMVSLERGKKIRKIERDDDMI